MDARRRAAVPAGMPRGVVAALAAACLTWALAGCGGQATATDPATEAPAATEQPAATEVPASPTAAGGELSASLDWPEGTQDFAVNLCASQGAHTIQGAGNSPDWKLYFDANLLTPQDTGTLQVSQVSDMTVQYDADIVALTVQPDGTFTATGADAAGAPFRLTGTCTISW